MQEICWGIIGCGDVTEKKSGPAFSKIPQSKLVAVMRRDAAKAADYARRHYVPRWYANADELIQDPEVNAIYIATPPDAHLEYTLKAAAAGKPVYVEKPMALNYNQCQQMIAACAEAQVSLYVAYYRRGQPFFRKIKELITSGAIGEVRLVNIRLYHPAKPDLSPTDLPWRVQPEISGGGLFFDLASHQLDLLDFFFGPITQAQGHTANQAGLYPAEDIVTANFSFDSGVQGSGVWCFTVAESARTDQTEIIGSAGRITYATFDSDIITLETAAGKQEIQIPYPEHVQQPLIQEMVAALLGQGTCPSTGESAARTALVMDKITATP
ncbi:Gfo/Idh/MocA family protein [Adhaeribacter rhizoryzae]|uniref:Gfo/Idh/MocA family oxidoreductase n=1 Tax=Adhaeribacter rhizoryzae TaxID=2607907 RepID=A0A5M6DCN3_9BACT|nr:Gfo/Idh/MocA family oxidoreductase [Adhaeribacter rhizoryzae]KAA5544082.1 Gfo/Idh/MocA family oxidoreductase [Adhaeribacter rhizoryzae]